MEDFSEGVLSGSRRMRRSPGTEITSAWYLATGKSAGASKCSSVLLEYCVHIRQCEKVEVGEWVQGELVGCSQDRTDFRTLFSDMIE